MMGIIMAWAVGYVIGSRSGPKEFDDVIKAVKELRDSEEAKALFAVLRDHAAHALRATADLLERSENPAADIATDLLTRVRLMTERD